MTDNLDCHLLVYTNSISHRGNNNQAFEILQTSIHNLINFNTQAKEKRHTGFLTYLSQNRRPTQVFATKLSMVIKTYRKIGEMWDFSLL